MKRLLPLAALAVMLLGCGGAPAATEAPAPAASSTSTPAPAPTAGGAATAAVPATAAPGPVALPREEEMRARKSLDPGEAPFPSIEEVTKELGPPAASGTGRRMQWWFGTKPLDKTYSCDTIDLIQLPSGSAAFDQSVYTSPECKRAKASDAAVRALLGRLRGPGDEQDLPMQLLVDGLQGKRFDEVLPLFEQALGKAQEAGDVEMALWRYLDEIEGACRSVLVTKHLGSGAGQALWGIPCG